MHVDFTTRSTIYCVNECSIYIIYYILLYILYNIYTIYTIICPCCDLMLCLRDHYRHTVYVECNTSTPSIVLDHWAEITNAIQVVMSTFFSLRNNLPVDITCTLEILTSVAGHACLLLSLVSIRIFIYWEWTLETHTSGKRVLLREPILPCNFASVLHQCIKMLEKLESIPADFWQHTYPGYVNTCFFLNKKTFRFR